MLALDIERTCAYQKLLDRILDLAWIVDGTGQIHLTNTAGQNYLGRSPASSPVFLWDLFSIAQQDAAKTQWKQNFDRLWQSKQELRDAVGNYNLFSLELEPLTSDNNISLWLGIASGDRSSVSATIESELTDYKQKELKLQRNVEFVRRIMESSNDCIKVLDLQGRLLYMNDGGQNIMEIDDFTQVQYSPWLNFWYDCDRQEAERAFNLAKTGKVARFDGFCATAKGTPKWWEVVVTPMFDKDNRVTEILSVSRDITSRKVAERALQERNRELDRFTYVVSHDLKAPLRGIYNLSQWIIEDFATQIPDEMKQQLNLLYRRVRRMDALVDGLLKFSKLGRQKLPTESIDVGELLQETIEVLAVPDNFQITKAHLPVLFTKRLLLTQVFSNLISNAIKHHDRDTGKIEITALDCNTYYQFAIADNGPGIPESERERIFEIFQTLNNNTSSTNTGIGLALVQKIVRDEGGKIWLEENSPRGCKFCFTWANAATQ